MDSAPQPASETISKVVFKGYQEMMGQVGLDVPAGHFHFRDITRLKESLRKKYGPQGAYGVSLRAGRASFRYWLDAYGPVNDLTGLPFRLMPRGVRLNQGLEILAQVLKCECGFDIQVREEGERWLWHMTGCPECMPDGEDRCSFTIGLLQEYLAWASGGKYFVVRELPRSNDDPHISEIEILRQPLD